MLKDILTITTTSDKITLTHLPDQRTFSHNVNMSFTEHRFKNLDWKKIIGEKLEKF